MPLQVGFSQLHTNCFTYDLLVLGVFLLRLRSVLIGTVGEVTLSHTSASLGLVLSWPRHCSYNLTALGRISVPSLDIHDSILAVVG